MNVTKIKFKGNETEIDYQIEQGITTLETKMKCSKPRDPDFTRCAENLINPLVKYLDLPDSWGTCGDIIFRSVSFSENETQGFGCVVTLLKELDDFNAPLVINTPHFCEGSEHQSKSVMPSNILTLLTTLQQHAIAFINGKRSQTEIDFKVDGETGEIQEDLL